MIVDVADSVVSLSIGQVKDKMDMTDNWFKKASFDKLKIAKDVGGNGEYDVYRVTLDDYSKAENGCDYSFIHSQALDKLESQGVDIYLYKHDVLILPLIDCGWGGLAHIGCSS